MIIGIDLGTTNSLVSVFIDGKPTLIPNALGHLMTPSIVAIDDNNEIIVGLPAREIMLLKPEYGVDTFKRYMGTNKSFEIGNKNFRADELSSFILKSLKADAEDFLGEVIDEAVITVPAFFSEPQRKATRIAGQLAGLKVERLLNEPTAASLAYGLHSKKNENQFLVFDLGGGTFDVSILEMFDNIMEVRASAGDNHLGGEDWVELLVNGFISEVAKEAGLKDKHINGKIITTLHSQAEKAKRKLSQSETAELNIVWQNKTLRWEISVDKFEKLSAGLLARLRAPIERALRDARIRPNELDEIVLVGGATRKPMIRKLVARMFGRLPSAQINPDEVVALGAAVQAGLKARDSALNEIVVTDVCPYTLGIDLTKSMGNNRSQAGFYEPIIERNSTIPISRVQSFVPSDEHQTEVLINIYQGESPLVKDNIYLECIHLPIPANSTAQENFDVRFTYDINGLLEVEALVHSSGVKKSIVIEENPGVLTAQEVQQRLKELSKLKIHPRDLTKNKTVMKRAERIYEDNIGEIREYVQKGIEDFMRILERQDPKEVDEARDQFNLLLDEIDGHTYL